MQLYRIGECRRWRFWLLLPRQKELALARKLLLLLLLLRLLLLLPLPLLQARTSYQTYRQSAGWQ